MSTEPSPSHTRDCSDSSTILSYPSSPASSGFNEPACNNTILLESNEFTCERLDRTRLALVVCYSKAEELPKSFWIDPKGGYISFMADNQFLESTQFIKHPFEIYNSMLAEFIDLPPLSEWKYPSWKYSFFLLKAKELSEAQCLDISNWIKILDTNIMEYLRKAPLSPRLVQYTDRGTSPLPQEVKTIRHVEHGTQTQKACKRKRFDTEVVCTESSKAPNVVLRENKDEERKVKRARVSQVAMVATIIHGTGTRSDPIVVHD